MFLVTMEAQSQESPQLTIISQFMKIKTSYHHKACHSKIFVFSSKVLKKSCPRPWCVLFERQNPSAVKAKLKHRPLGHQEADESMVALCVCAHHPSDH